MSNLIDLNGNPVEPDTICLAERQNSNGTITIYFKEDAERFIDDMAAEGGIADFTSKEEWLSSACDRQAGNKCSSGSCPAGKSCQAVSLGSGTYCRCK